jgi:membrane-associated phospholipid phosphatase
MMMKRLASAFLLFISCSCSSQAQNTDINWLRSINSGGTLFRDNSCIVLSKSVTPMLIAEPLTVFVFGMIKKNDTLKRKSYVICASLLTAGAISTGMKYVFNRERPFVTYPFITKKIEAGSPSFPSGHTSAAFSIAASLSFAFPKWYVIAPSFLWAAGVGYSRMELGVHYPSDVLVGALVGAASSWLMYEGNRWLKQKKREEHMNHF